MRLPKIVIASILGLILLSSHVGGSSTTPPDDGSPPIPPSNADSTITPPAGNTSPTVGNPTSSAPIDNSPPTPTPLAGDNPTTPPGGSSPANPSPPLDWVPPTPRSVSYSPPPPPVDSIPITPPVGGTPPPSTPPIDSSTSPPVGDSPSTPPPVSGSPSTSPVGGSPTTPIGDSPSTPPPVSDSPSSPPPISVSPTTPPAIDNPSTPPPVSGIPSTPPPVSGSPSTPPPIDNTPLPPPADNNSTTPPPIGSTPPAPLPPPVVSNSTTPPASGTPATPPSPIGGSPTSPPPPVDSSPTTPPPINGSLTTANGLHVGFYRGLCPNKTADVEALIETKVKSQFSKDPTILPALLRMQFHDCFVNGCDASILIAGNTTERKAGPNLTVRGYEFIDALKAFLETQCPGVVSCADIIAIATKVVIKLGGGPNYLVQTGRRDGLRSNASDVNLPSPSMTVPQSASVFAAKGFTVEEMVALLGCHTVGVAHCAFFENRLFSGTSEFDPNMDPNLRKQLILTCPRGKKSNNVAFLDQNSQSSNKFDNSFFGQLQRNRGLLPLDQALARNSQTNGTVSQLAQNATLFNAKLADAMVKLQALDVLTGQQGAIRNVCSKFN